MKEFDGVKINLLTINTPVRDDYQLSKQAAERVNHVNVYDPRDPVQILGGRTKIPLTNKYVEGGIAGRRFKNAKNISVDNPQGIIDHLEYNPVLNGYYAIPGDVHNSHNRMQDWKDK